MLQHTSNSKSIQFYKLIAVPGAKSRKRSAATMAAWEDDDPVQHPGQADTLDLTEDDLALSEVALSNTQLLTACTTLMLYARLGTQL